MKNIIRKISATIITISILNACVLFDKVETHVLYAPQLELSFEKISIPEELVDAEILIFDSDNVLFYQKTITKEELQANQTIPIIKGVTAGDYRMIGFYNVANLKIEDLNTDTGAGKGPLTVKYTKLNDVVTQLEKIATPIPDAFEYKNLNDYLYYSDDKFTLERGFEKTVVTANISHAHYKCNVQITGIDNVTGEIGEISMKLQNAPTDMDIYLNPFRERYDQDIELINHMDDVDNDSEINMSGECFSLYFDYQDNVKLQIYEDGRLMRSLTLNPALYVTDETKNILNIHIEFLADIYIIHVNDWKQAYSLISLGV